MKLSKERISYLLNSYTSRKATAVERQELTEWLAKGENADISEEYVADLLDNYSTGQEEAAAEWDPMFQKILAARSRRSTIAPVYKLRSLKTSWMRYAAILLLIAATAVFLYLNKPSQPEVANKQPIVQPDIVPGGNKATLTLADGSNIVLDSAAVGSLAKQGNTSILKRDAGSLAYNAGTILTDKILYNTLTTPKGGQYQVTLTDGTKVWLNAASSIKFPTVFVKDRKVMITGEVYFEVNKNKEKPFIVDVDGKSSIEVLGTSFNVSSYSDEPVQKTTLLEGAVQVNYGTKQVLLKPGQQAEAAGNGQLKLVDNTDLVQTIAWKNGVFNFEKIPLEQAMRQLSNWYNIEVVYEKGVPAITFWGEIKRTLELPKVLKFLEKTGVHFRMEGRRIIIIP